MLHNFTDGSTIDILAIENGDTDVAISALTSGRLTVETLTFVMMVSLISHVPEFTQLSNEITAATQDPISLRPRELHLPRVHECSNPGTAGIEHCIRGKRAAVAVRTSKTKL